MPSVQPGDQQLTTEVHVMDKHDHIQVSMEPLRQSAWEEYLDQFPAIKYKHSKSDTDTGKAKTTTLSLTQSGDSATSIPKQISCNIQSSNVIPQRLRSEHKRYSNCNLAEDEEEEIIFKTNEIAQRLNFS